MARRRMIDPDFWVDEKVAALSFPARLVFISIWNYADDFGYYEANHDRMKAVLFPYENGKFNIQGFLAEIINLGMVDVYVVEGKEYHKIKNFNKYQTISHPTPSKLSAFLENSGKFANAPETSPQVKLSQVKLSQAKLSFYVDFEKSTLDLWNAFVDKYPSLSKIQVITPTRREHLKRRFEQETFKAFPKILEAIVRQPKLINGFGGEKHKGWRISFDWLIANDLNHVKVLEGRYGTGNIEAGQSILDKYIKPE